MPDNIVVGIDIAKHKFDVAVFFIRGRVRISSKRRIYTPANRSLDE